MTIPATARPSPSFSPPDSRMRLRALMPRTIGTIGTPTTAVTSEATA